MRNQPGVHPKDGLPASKPDAFQTFSIRGIGYYTNHVSASIELPVALARKLSIMRDGLTQCRAQPYLGVPTRAESVKAEKAS